MILVAYDTGARRSELEALAVANLTFDDDGSGTVLIATSKTDQEGQGSIRYLSQQTIRAVREWLDASRVADGPLFRSVPRIGTEPKPLDGDAIYRIFRAMARRAGIDLASVGGHSLRVGMAQDTVARYSEHLSVKREAAAKLTAMQGRI